ncbi:MAG TPA: hypothetical protein VGH87_06770 [Polyangiaceae bacterium]
MRRTILACVLVACSSSSPKTANVVVPVATTAPVVKESYPCIQLHSDVDTIMKDARYKWHAGSASGEGVTHTSWVVIKTGKPHPARANISWGPIVDGGDDEFPYETTIYFETNEDAGTPEQRARRMLRDLGFMGSLQQAVLQFQMTKNLDERGLTTDGHLPPKTWALLQSIFKETQDDKTAPAECED